MYVYIHLPFCASQCIYCDFAIVKKGTDELKTQYLKALLTEMTEALKQQKKLSPIKTLYFGGGTPSQYSAQSITQIFNTLKQFTPFSPTAEITFEMNPEGPASPVDEYLALGINRISVGVQSLQPNELKRLSRIHSAQKAIGFIEELATQGVQNISVDVMHGIPEQTPNSWQNTLETLCQLPIQHISAYGLQVEEDTPLYHLVKANKMPLPVEEDMLAFYEITQSVLPRYGFKQYEISNYAKPNYESQHNLNYWVQGQYFAFGLGAHGYVNNTRYENTSDLAAYLKNPTQKELEYLVTAEEHQENKLIFGLRLNRGIDLTKLFTSKEVEPILKTSQSLAEKGLLSLTSSQIKLTPKGQVLSNSVIEVLLEALKVPL